MTDVKRRKLLTLLGYSSLSLVARPGASAGTKVARPADVLILGCAGMAAHRGPLQAALGIPVVEPCQAAVLHLRAQLDMGLCRAPAPRPGIAAQ